MQGSHEYVMEQSTLLSYLCFTQKLRLFCLTSSQSITGIIKFSIFLVTKISPP